MEVQNEVPMEEGMSVVPHVEVEIGEQIDSEISVFAKAENKAEILGHENCNLMQTSSTAVSHSGDGIDRPYFDEFASTSKSLVVAMKARKLKYTKIESRTRLPRKSKTKAIESMRSIMTCVSPQKKESKEERRKQKSKRLGRLRPKTWRRPLRAAAGARHRVAKKVKSSRRRGAKSATAVSLRTSGLSLLSGTSVGSLSCHSECPRCGQFHPDNVPHRHTRSRF